jgi:hypothetical protein
LGWRFVRVNGSPSEGIFAANEVDDCGPPAIGRRAEANGLNRSRADVGCRRVALCHVRTIAESLSNNVPETAANLSKDMGSKSSRLAIMSWLNRFRLELQAV